MKQLKMFTYNKLRELNPEAAKTKDGRSLLMREANLTAKVKSARQIAFNIARLIYPFSNIEDYEKP